MVRTRTRDDIIAAAAELFSRFGFKGTSLQDIAAEVGCSKATLLYHFHSKEAILAALIAPAARELAALDARLATLGGEAARTAAIDGFVDLALRYRREAALIYYGSLDVRESPEFAHLRPLTENLCAAFAARSTGPADCVAAGVVLGGICSVAIGNPDDLLLRSALADVARRALTTPRSKD